MDLFTYLLSTIAGVFTGLAIVAIVKGNATRKSVKAINASTKATWDNTMAIMEQTNTITQGTIHMLEEFRKGNYAVKATPLGSSLTTDLKKKGNGTHDG